MRWTRTRLAAASALLLGATLRAIFIVHHPRIAGDALVYADLAHNLLTTHTFGLTEQTVRPTLIRLPGYPLFLAACFALFGGVRFEPVLWLQGSIDLCSCALLAWLARRLWGQRAGLATLWLACLCPFTANYTAVAIAETLSLFCVIVAFYGLERWDRTLARTPEPNGRSLVWATVIGVGLAVAVLLRPDQGLLAAAVLPCMLWRAWRLRAHAGSARRSVPARASVLSLGATSLLFLLPLLAWGVRNWRVFGVIQPLAPRYANDPGELVSFGFQRWYRTWAIDFESSLRVYWAYDGDELRLADLPRRAIDDAAQRAETAAVYRLYNREQAASPRVDAAFGRLAQERVSAQPLRYYVWLPVCRELNMWLRPRTELMKLPVAWWRVGADPLGSATALGYAVLNAAYLAMGVVGLVRWWKAGWIGRPILALAMLGFVVLRCVLLLTVDNSEPRYTLECFPIVFLLGGIGVGPRRAGTLDSPL